jgi:hypothetical protein
VTRSAVSSYTHLWQLRRTRVAADHLVARQACASKIVPLPRRIRNAEASEETISRPASGPRSQATQAFVWINQQPQITAL